MVNFKGFLASVICFLAAIALTRGNSILEMPTFWYSVLAALVSVIFTKIVFAIFGLTSQSVEPKEVGGQKSKIALFIERYLTVSNIIALFTGTITFIFSSME